MTAVTTPQLQQPIRSTVPARLDRLQWSPLHARLVLGPGTVWVLDGLPVTIASSVAGDLTQPNTLNLTTTQPPPSAPSTRSARSSARWCFSRLLACDHRRLGGG
jgi:hypothetical protein